MMSSDGSEINFPAPVFRYCSDTLLNKTKAVVTSFPLIIEHGISVTHFHWITCLVKEDFRLQDKHDVFRNKFN
jgi:hypothetical protein